MSKPSVWDDLQKATLPALALATEAEVYDHISPLLDKALARGRALEAVTKIAKEWALDVQETDCTCGADGVVGIECFPHEILAQLADMDEERSGG